MATTMNQSLLTSSQAGQLLGVTASALSQMRYLGTGPKFLKLGARTVRYRQADLDEWLEAAVRTRTDERPGRSA